GARRALARRLDALLGHLRAPATVLSRGSAAARHQDPAGGRAGIGAGLGALCRRQRPRHGHEGFRRVRAAQGAAAPVRFRARPRRRGGPGNARTQVNKEEAMVNDAAPVKQPALGDTIAVAPPCAMVIFGGGGDLTKRLIMPALYNLVMAKRLPDGFRIVGID